MSDFSAFHRIDAPELLSAARFIGLASQLWKYRGALRETLTIEGRDDSPDSMTPAASAAGRDGLNRDRVVDSDATTLMTDPAFAGLFSPMRGSSNAEGRETP